MPFPEAPLLSAWSGAGSPDGGEPQARARFCGWWSDGQDTLEGALLLPAEGRFGAQAGGLPAGA